MTQLSVNVNKLATLRNAREKNLPDVTALSEKILRYGAHGITVHPRPDGRHIRLADVTSLHQLVQSWNESSGKRPVEFNIEGYPSDEFLQLIERVRPHQCTLVPDLPEAITSDAGWNLVREEPRLAEILQSLRDCKVRSSLFIDPAEFDDQQAAALKRLHPDRVELYTEAYAEHFAKSDRASVTERYRQAALSARELKIGVNAGHDLNQVNLGYLLEQIPWINEVSIGHALICEALEQGLEKTITAYGQILHNV